MLTIACILKVAEPSILPKLLLACWQASIVQKSGCLGSLKALNETDAEEYHFEVIASLQEATDMGDQIDILDEFADEVVLDLSLKSICFRSRELLVQCFNLCMDAITNPPSKLLETDTQNSPSKLRKSKSIAGMFGESVSKSTSSNRWSKVRSSVSSTHDMTDSERRNRLKAVALERLCLVRSVFRVLSSLFFRSECLPIRRTVLAGPVPLTQDAWLTILTPNMYSRICSALGCHDTDEPADIASEIDKSLSQLYVSMESNVGESLDNSFLSKLYGDKRELFPASTRNRALSVENYTPRRRNQSFSDLVMTPVRKRQQQSLEFVVQATPELPFG